MAQTDTFNRADAGTLGGLWSLSAGSFAISSNTARPTNTGVFSRAEYNPGTYPSNQYAQTVSEYINSGGSQIMPALHVQPDDSCYVVFFNGANDFRLFRLDGSTPTQLDADTVTTAQTTLFTFKLERIGNDVVAYKDGVEVLRATDTTYTNGSPGLFGAADSTTASTQARCDSFECSDQAGGANVVPLLMALARRMKD